MLIANLGLLFTVLAWGSTSPAIHALLNEWDPISLVAARLILTTSVFAVWLRFSEGSVLGSSNIPWRKVFILGSILAIFSIFLTIALSFSNPINLAVIGAASPISASLINRFLTGQNPPKPILAVLPIAVIGGLLADLDLEALLAGEPAFKFEGGELMMVVCIFLWPLYSALTQRWFDDMSQLRRTAYSFAAATPMVGIVTFFLLIFGWEELPAEVPDLRGWGLFIWTSLATSILGTFFWNVSVGRVGVVIATMALNLIPAVTIVIAMMFGIEPRIEQLLGCGLVIVAIAQAQYRLYISKEKSID